MDSLFSYLTSRHADLCTLLSGSELTTLCLAGCFAEVISAVQPESVVVMLGSSRSHSLLADAELLRLAQAAKRFYFASQPDRNFTPYNSLGELPNCTRLKPLPLHPADETSLLVAVGQGQCALFAAQPVPDARRDARQSVELLWSFEPKLFAAAMAYLIAGYESEHPASPHNLSALLPLSLQRRVTKNLAQAFTTTLAVRLQRHHELEYALRRLSATIAKEPTIEAVLQTAVREMGEALTARRTALALWRDGQRQSKPAWVYERGDGDLSPMMPKPKVRAAASGGESRGLRQSAKSSALPPGPLELAITYQERMIGVLVIEDDTPGRVWEEEEEQFVYTIADHLAVAINQSHLFYQVQTQTVTDPLTGIFNQRYFLKRLKREVKLADRNTERVSLIWLNLDHLTRVNDTYGYRKGDVVLRQVARRLQSAVRDLDICARYGDDDFVILLPQCNREGVKVIARRLRDLIAASPIEEAGQITASLGVVTYPAMATSAEEMLEKAKRACRMAKQAGRNRVRGFQNYPQWNTRLLK